MPDRPIDILVVEDDPDHVELALHALAEFSATTRIHVARDGAEALDFLFARGAYAVRDVVRDAPRVVLLDLKLPRVDGLDVLRQVKSDPRTKAIPVVMLTSSRLEQDVLESYELGVNSYIVKPMGYDQFMKSMKEIGLYWLMLNVPVNS